MRGQQTVDAAAAAVPAAAGEDLLKLATSNGCMACHGVSNKIVGPAYTDVAAKYKGQADAVEVLVAKVKNGGKGAWGAIPMPPQGHVADEDITRLVNWILSGAKAQ